MTSNKLRQTWDVITQRVFGFFVAKGFLIVPGINPLPNVKINIEEALRVGTEIEPHVLEVLPAALLRFPRSFLNWSAVPPKLNEILDCLRKNLNKGPDLAGLPYKDLKRWANRKLPDSRTVPLKERRIMKSLRFKPSTIELLKKRAKDEKITETEVIERLLCS